MCYCDSGIELIFHKDHDAYYTLFLKPAMFDLHTDGSWYG